MAKITITMEIPDDVELDEDAVEDLLSAVAVGLDDVRPHLGDETQVTIEWQKGGVRWRR